MIGNDETYFLHNLLITNRQVLSLYITFKNIVRKYKIIKSSTIKKILFRRFSWKFHEPLMKVGLPLIKTVFTLLAKSELIKLELIAASETQIQENFCLWGLMVWEKEKRMLLKQLKMKQNAKR